MSEGETSFLAGPAGRLEALWQPGEEGRGAALLCHPHPQYGGTLRDRVVHRMARALRAAGLGVLRFNFRGVGASEGAFDEGRGERDDARAALDHLARTHGRVLVAGYSFGSWVALAVGAGDPRVGALCGVGLPANALAFEGLAAARQPLLVVQGERDAWGSVERVRAVAATAGGATRVVIVPGADHGFRGGLEAMTDAVTDFARGLS